MAERSATGDQEQATRRGRRARPRRWIAPVLAGAVLVVAAAVLAAWLLRGPIGARVATQWLRSHGTSADIHIQRLDSSGFTGSVLIGPAADPDLTVERLEVRFAPGWNLLQGAPQIASIRLTRPVLKAAFDGRRLRLGSLQRLADELTARPPSGAPPPQISASDGLVRLATPAGPVAIHADFALDRGRLTWLNARIGPTRLAHGGDSAVVRAASLALTGSGERLDGRLHLEAAQAAFGAVQAQDLVIELKLATANPAPGRLRIEGPASLSGTIRAARLRSQGGQTLAAPALQLSYGGALQASADGAAAEGQGRLELTAAALDGAGPTASGLRARLALPSLKLELGRGGAGLEAALDGAIGADRILLPGAWGLELRRAGWSGRGEASLGGAASLRWRGPLQARTALPAAAARRLTQGLPLTEAGNAALARALEGGRAEAPDLELAAGPGTLTLAAFAPARLSAPGLTASVTPRGRAPLFDARAHGGALDLRIAGPAAPQVTAEIRRYALGAGSVEAEGRYRAALDTPLARGVTLAADGRLRVGTGGVRFAASGCASVAAAEAGTGAPVATQLKGELCPEGGRPLLAAGGSGWRVIGEGRDVSGLAPPLEVAFAEGRGRVDVRGPAAAGAAGAVEIDRAVVSDKAAVRRFLPVLVSGPLTSSGGPWSGRLRLAEAAHGRPIGAVQVVQDPSTGAGRATIAAPDLRFAPDGLQPGEVFPAARTLAGKATGEASFEGQAAWTSAGLTSSGELKTAGLSFESPMGKVENLRTDLKLTSLAPLASAPHQSLSADSLDWMVSLGRPSARFSIGPDALTIEDAQAEASGGTLRVAPMVLPLGTAREVTSKLFLSDIDLGALVASTSLADKVTVQAKIAGEVAFGIGPDGLRIEGGRLYATGPGRLTIARSALAGAVATSASGGTSAVVQDFAYQALEDLVFQTLDATLQPRDKGRLGAVFLIKGRHDPPKAPPPLRVGIFDLLRGKALDKPLALPKGTPINLTLDVSLNFDELLKAYMDAMKQIGSAAVQP
jgi:hypothetical protein